MSCFKPSNRAKVSEKLAAGNEFENEVKVTRVLTKTFEVNNKRVLEVAQNGVLANDVVDLFEPDDLGLFERLQGNVFVCCLVSSEFHTAK